MLKIDCFKCSNKNNCVVHKARVVAKSCPCLNSPLGYSLRSGSADYYFIDSRRFLADLWRINCGYSSAELLTEKAETLDSLKSSEWSKIFERMVRFCTHDITCEEFEVFFILMKNRLVMGRFRYGKLNAENKPKWDRIERVIKEVALYEKDGNTERLIDISNMCLLEFEEGDSDKIELVKSASMAIVDFFRGSHPGKHFKSTDDSLHNREMTNA